MKAPLKLIKITRSGKLALLTNIQEFPTIGWLMYQRTEPLPDKSWYRAWPIGSGEVLVQEGCYEVVQEVASSEYIELATNSSNFNPAADAIKEYIS